MFFHGSPSFGPFPSRRTLGRDPAGTPLFAEDFEWFLERERCLADRGTRLFSLIVARRRGRGSRDIGRLAVELRRRLRSTDLVGSLRGGDRIGALLTDTGLEGAQVVAGWTEGAATSLGLQVEVETFVYPQVPPSGRSERAEDLWPQLSIPPPAWKRALDVALSAVALALLAPVFAAVAIAIRLDSPGPVIFRQQRAGRAGRPFAFYKFRSMYVDAEQRRQTLQYLNEQVGPVFKIRNDPRITRVGRVLRRWSLDELPQIWNVLKGDFSLVGPRPPTLDEVGHYERWQRRRLNVSGGITGTWQVSGRSEIGFLEWMRMDMRYIARRSLWQDLVLLARSVPAVISGRGAY